MCSWKKNMLPVRSGFCCSDLGILWPHKNIRERIFYDRVLLFNALVQRLLIKAHIQEAVANDNR